MHMFIAIPTIGRFTQQDTHWTNANRIYGDNPQKTNEREDRLGIQTYTYVPQIAAVLQSGNLYVYCMNDPVMYVDVSGEVTQKGTPPPSSGYKPPKRKKQRILGTEKKVAGKIDMEIYGFQIVQDTVSIVKPEKQITGMCRIKMEQATSMYVLMEIDGEDKGKPLKYQKQIRI